MPEQRRRFSPQFKAEAVQMVIETGKPIAVVARELGIHDGTLGNWVNAWRREHPEPDQPVNPTERARVKEMEEEIRRLRMENEFLKKSRGLLRPDAPVAVRCALIDAEKATYPVAWMCRMLRVPRSTFYAWRNRAETATTARRRQLAEQVRRVFDASRGTYGCRRVTAALNREGIACSVGLVADLMRELGLQACQPRAYKRTTVPGQQPVSSPDLIAREFTAAQPGTRLVGDITYLRTGPGRAGCSWPPSSTWPPAWSSAGRPPTTCAPASSSTPSPWRNDTDIYAPAPCSTAIAAQYTSAEFARFCTANKIRTSVGRTGVCWDNAAAESFFATLKNEMYHRQRFDTRARASFAVAEYIEIFYNRQRLHSALDYRTPAEALTESQTRIAA
ncbi:Transposase and inactivated derivatives [Micromonospora rhizosphaerae]|uniref:Transposase and inactivated derivatives n=1 Tax=Micromonospora rhizosphaerae TaxID=568872 RepID=A0A1C6SCN4_9ACTN|nr:Transposase and inactivated derivatives [Micromonospora rhizosphaerae]